MHAYGIVVNFPSAHGRPHLTRTRNQQDHWDSNTDNNVWPVQERPVSNARVHITNFT